MEKIISIAPDISKSSDFESLLAPYLNYLYKIALRFCGGSVADGEDLMQDLLIKLYTKRQQLAKIDRLKPWLVKVLYHTFLDHIRRQNRSPLHLVVKPRGEETDIVETIASPTKGPEEILTAGYSKTQLMTAVHNLKEEQRTVCILHDMEGYTLVELSAMLKIPLGTLKSRLHRARRRLRKDLLFKKITPDNRGN